MLEIDKAELLSLSEAAADSRNLSELRRGALLRDHRSTIARLLIALRKAQVIGRNDEPMDVPENCDLCGTDITEQGCYVDGGVAHGGGMWANMCLPCFDEHGKGIAWGVGQLYLFVAGRWQCIGGGDPNIPEEPS
jgi:hypothetical protein